MNMWGQYHTWLVKTNKFKKCFEKLQTRNNN